MKAIETKFLGPPDTKGSRIKASCDGCSVTVSYDHAYSQENNHRIAAWLLIERLGWERTDQDLRSGFLRECVWVHILDR